MFSVKRHEAHVSHKLRALQYNMEEQPKLT